MEEVLGSVFLHRCSGPLQLLAALTAIHHEPASAAPRMIALESLGSLGLASRVRPRAAAPPLYLTPRAAQGQPDVAVHWVHALRRLLRSPVSTCAVAVKPGARTAAPLPILFLSQACRAGPPLPRTQPTSWATAPRPPRMRTGSTCPAPGSSASPTA